MHPYHHALSSVRRYGGSVQDYLPIHHWFDASKASLGDFRHRALRHHTEGIFECERVFGPTLTNSAGKVVPTRYIGEQHVLEDLGRLPTLKDWLVNLRPAAWMSPPSRLEKILAAPLEGETPQGPDSAPHVGEVIRVPDSAPRPSQSRKSAARHLSSGKDSEFTLLTGPGPRVSPTQVKKSKTSRHPAGS